MKYFIYYTYYRLYQWSEKREKNIPVVIVLAWMAVTAYANVYTILSLADICFGVYAEHALTIHTSRFTSLIVISVWTLLIWVLLRIFHVKKRSFSREYIEKYKESGCRDWWIFAYFLISMAAMVGAGWVAGLRHRGGH